MVYIISKSHLSTSASKICLQIPVWHQMIEWLFAGNPLEEKHSAEGNWRDEAIKRLPRLKKLDGKNFL